MHVLTSVTDARDRLIAERDENTMRKAMTMSELVAVGDALRAIEEPKALERKVEGGRKGGQARPSDPDKLPPTLAEASKRPPNETREIEAEALGIGRTSISTARKIVRAAEACASVRGSGT